MKKILMLITALVAMLCVNGRSLLDIIPTASAQEVASGTIQDTVAVEQSASRALAASIAADSTQQNRGVGGRHISDDTGMFVYLDITDKPRIDTLFYARIKPTPTVVDSLPVLAEEPAEEPIQVLASGLINRPFESKKVKWAGRDRYGRYTEQCAAHANGRLGRAGYFSHGHAYQIPSHFPSVINGYKYVTVPNLSKLSWEKRVPAVVDMHRKAADYVKENLDISELDPKAYYVVNMYYTTSRYMLEFFYAARKQGTRNYGTHVGVLYYNTEAEAWIVEHNIHGHVHYDALVSILGGFSNPRKYGITSISKVSR